MENGTVGAMATKKSSAKKSPAKKQQQPDRVYPNGVEVLSSKVSFEGPVFRVVTEEVREPGGQPRRRDVIRHHGSAVIFAVDDSKSKRDPLILLERQYRHAAAQYLYEVPAGSLEPGEDPLAGAKRELLEETGYKAKHWSKLVRYYASPGFLGEWMQVFLAEGLTPGDAEPEDDEQIELFAVPLSELLREIEAGRILDGKTIAATLLYDRVRKQRQRAERAAVRAGRG
jgi:8-oxo-dGTP pyrophosphatase MutT (NUDIX family)